MVKNKGLENRLEREEMMKICICMDNRIQNKKYDQHIFYNKLLLFILLSNIEY